MIFLVFKSRPFGFAQGRLASVALTRYSQIVGFKDFLGNETTVRHLREGIAQGRLPHALILAGPRGSGKYTLALMLAQAVNCLNPTESDGLPDFCGICRNCARIADAMALDTRVEEAIATREEMREGDKKDTRILIQTHPDVLVIPPDPPQLLIKLGQVRTVIREIYRMPAEAKRAVYIFTSAAFMKEAANSLLKILEEPPAHASIFLLAENTGELLPTIRSRASIARLGALPLNQPGATHRGAALGFAASATLAGCAAGAGSGRSSARLRSGKNISPTGRMLLSCCIMRRARPITLLCFA